MPIMIQSSKVKLMCGGGKIAKMYCQGDVIYSSGNIVTYMVDTGVSYQEEVDEGESCLSPKTFTPAKSGWTFLGWREDTSASAAVLGSKVMGDEPVTLYAVFQQVITLSYSGNGNTGGSTASQTGYRYYNAGNSVNPTFIIRANGFTRTNYLFTGWMSGSTSYAVGQSIALSTNLTLTAQWYTTAATTLAYTGGIQTYAVPVTGLYLLRCYGARGGAGKYAGGNGGYAYYYAPLTKGQMLYVAVGGAGGAITGGYNGGGTGSSEGSAGGGCTHIATISGTLASIGSGNKSKVLLVAGGGGGGANVGTGGAGGGVSGADGTNGSSGKGGTQSSGGISGSTSGDPAGFGKGANQIGSASISGGGGGGGLYGGGCGGNHNGGSPGGGGSGYIPAASTAYNGITYTNATSVGGNDGNGYASIQLIAL